MLMEDMESLPTLAWTDQCVRQQTLEQECTQQARTIDKHNCSDSIDSRAGVYPAG